MIARGTDLDMEAYYRNSLPVEERPITWDEIATLEPKLADLLEQAWTDKRRGNKSWDRWYEYYKPNLVRLVGHGREQSPAVMRGRSAYDVAYRTLLNALESRPR